MPLLTRSTAEDLKAESVKELQARCREYHLKVAGADKKLFKKDELVSLLTREHHRKDLGRVNLRPAYITKQGIPYQVSAVRCEGTGKTWVQFSNQTLLWCYSDDNVKFEDSTARNVKGKGKGPLRKRKSDSDSDGDTAAGGGGKARSNKAPKIASSPSNATTMPPQRGVGATLEEATRNKFSALSGVGASSGLASASAEPASADGEVNGPQGDYHAMCVGVDQYHKSKGLKELTHAKKDASDVLVQLTDRGFQIYKRDVLEPKGKLDFEKQVRLFFQSKSIKNGDTAFLYFAGHGEFQKRSKDLRLHSYDTSIELKKILEIVEERRSSLPNFTVGLILDCCRNSDHGRGGGPKAPMLVTSGNSCPGLFIWYSCLEGRPAADKSLQGQNGLFCNHLVRALAQPPEQVQWINVVRAVARGMENEEAVKQQKEHEDRQRPQYTETFYHRLFLKAKQGPSQGTLEEGRPAHSLSGSSVAGD